LAAQVEEQVVRSASPIESPPDGSGLEVAVAGAELAGEFRCAECGYGAVVHRVLPQCPMCGGVVWEHSSSRTHG